MKGLYFAAVSISDTVLDATYPKLFICVESVCKDIIWKGQGKKQRKLVFLVEAGSYVH